MADDEKELGRTGSILGSFFRRTMSFSGEDSQTFDENEADDLQLSSRLTTRHYSLLNPTEQGQKGSDSASYGYGPNMTSLAPNMSQSAVDTINSRQTLPSLTGRTRAFSLTSVLLGQRGSNGTNQPDLLQPVHGSSEEISDNGNAGLASSSSAEIVTEEQKETVNPEREVSQTDHLNKWLLQSFLGRMNSNPTAGNQPVNDTECANTETNDYGTIYTDDLLIDQICRRLESSEK